MCDATRDKLPAFAAETLAENDRARVEAHLAGCAACRSALADWQAIGVAVRGTVAARAVDLPAYLPPDLVPAAETAAGPRRRMLAGNSRGLALLILLALMVPLTLRISDRIIRHGQIEYDQIEPGPAVPGPRTRAPVPTPVARAVRPIARVRPSPLLTASDGGTSNAVSNDSASNASAIAGLAYPANSQATNRLSYAAGASPATSMVPLVMSTATTAVDPDPTRGTEPRSEEPESTDVPFTPSPVPNPLSPPTGTPVPTTGTILGTVRGPDRQPRAEILIVAEMEGGAGAEVSGMTNVAGAYALVLPPGAWIVHAETPAYQLMWHVGKPNPIFADPVEVAIGAVVAVDFDLEPSPAGLIGGRVTDAGGAPIARAVVIAAIPDNGPNRSPVLSTAVFTDDAGEYRLAVPPGAYFLATSLTRRREDLVWWGGDGSFQQADRVGVNGSGSVRGIDIVLGR